MAIFNSKLLNYQRVPTFQSSWIDLSILSQPLGGSPHSSSSGLGTSLQSLARLGFDETGGQIPLRNAARVSGKVVEHLQELYKKTSVWEMVMFHLSWESFPLLVQLLAMNHMMIGSNKNTVVHGVKHVKSPCYFWKCALWNPAIPKHNGAYHHRKIPQKSQAIHPKNWMTMMTMTMLMLMPGQCRWGWWWWWWW